MATKFKTGDYVIFSHLGMKRQAQVSAYLGSGFYAIEYEEMTVDWANKRTRLVTVKHKQNVNVRNLLLDPNPPKPYSDGLDNWV